MPPAAEAPLRVLFVCINDFRDASAKQALWFGQELVRRGNPVLFSIAGDPATAASEGAREHVEVRCHRFIGSRVSAADLAAAKAFAPDLIHCWNPRLGSVKVARGYARVTGAPVVFHWEDDEWRIRSDSMNRSLLRRGLRPAKRIVAHVRPRLGVTMDEGSRRWISAHAAGLDALTPALAQHVAARIGKPCQPILPANPTGEVVVGEPASWPPAIGSHPVALWTGSVHPGIEADVRAAMAAVAEVQRRGHELTFVHVGEVLTRYDTAAWIREAGLNARTAHFLGYVPYERIPGMLAGSAVLLSSGAPNDYNRLRLPSKVQAYLASGSPTITFATGFGELLADREEAMLVRTDEVGEIADAIVAVLTDPALRDRLRSGGPAAAQRLFDPVRNTDTMLAYYRGALVS